MAFAGRRVLVTGGTGTVGSGVVQALLRQGAKVLVSTRSRDKFEALRATLPAAANNHLSLCLADVTTEEGAQQILADCRKQDGGLQHVVASLGSWWQKGRLVDQSLQEFNQVLEDLVTSHFLLFRALQPYLDTQKDSSYTVITGNAGSQYLVEGMSLLCVGSGALNGMALAARAEHAHSQVAVGEVRITCLVHPKSDKEFQESDGFNVGNDLIGSAIVGTMAARSRDQVKLETRHDAKEWLL